ncbi:hypothetical protein Tco_1546378 [Tanacetum coccineum]
MLAPSSGGLILYQAYGNLYAMTGRKAHLLEDKQIPSVGVFDEIAFILGTNDSHCSFDRILELLLYIPLLEKSEWLTGKETSNPFKIFNDSPLTGVNTPGSDENRLKLYDLMYIIVNNSDSYLRDILGDILGKDMYYPLTFVKPIRVSLVYKRNPKAQCYVRNTCNNDKSLSEIQLEHEKEDELVMVVVKVVHELDYRMVVKEIEDGLLEEIEKFGRWFEQDIDGESEYDNEKKLVMVNKGGCMS